MCRRPHAPGRLSYDLHRAIAMRKNCTAYALEGMDAIAALILPADDDVVYLQNHLHHLCGELHLLLLPNQRLEDTLLLHVHRPRLIAVDAPECSAISDVSGPDAAEREDRVQAGVLRQRHRDVLQRLGKCPDRVLLKPLHRVCELLDLLRAGDFRRSPSIDDLVPHDEIPHHAHGIVQRTLCFVHDHPVAAPDEHRHGVLVGRVLDHQHALLGGAEGHLAYRAGVPKLFRREL
mmetsp:Transcript_15274/g.58094  ORF Transcript_15274/g.58094 Transcript_15274/m.58094 type:complete len:233 (-) Transcript_15274:1100-1798(-)